MCQTKQHVSPIWLLPDLRADFDPMWVARCVSHSGQLAHVVVSFCVGFMDCLCKQHKMETNHFEGALF